MWAMLFEFFNLVLPTRYYKQNFRQKLELVESELKLGKSVKDYVT